MSGATQICSSNVSSISVDALFLPPLSPPVPLPPMSVRTMYVYDDANIQVCALYTRVWIRG